MLLRISNYTIALVLVFTSVCQAFEPTVSESVEINRWLLNQQITSDLKFELITSDKTPDGTFHKRYNVYSKGILIENLQIITHRTLDNHFFITGNEKLFLIVDQFLKENFSELISDKIQDHDDIVVLVDQDAENVFSLRFVIKQKVSNSTTGDVIYKDINSRSEITRESLIREGNQTGIASTKYNGLQNINTNLQSGQYELKSHTINSKVLSLNNQTSYTTPTPFYDNDNIWDDTLNHHYATDALYSSQKYHEFLQLEFNRNSIDNNGTLLSNYINYGAGLENAFWNGQAVVYGSGGVNRTAMTTLDIAGHEFTHGLIQHTANLKYKNESGALNEAICDMMGVALESFTRQSFNWLIAEESGAPLRSLEDPSLLGQPMFYRGQNWYYGVNDHGGVHINSGVINYWFYLMVNGGTGINEIGQSYSINGIGINSTVQIVYNTLVGYLLPTSDFKEFRKLVLLNTAKEYGYCSDEFNTTYQAFKVVGISNTMRTQDASLRNLTSKSIDTQLSINDLNKVENINLYDVPIWDDSSNLTMSNKVCVNLNNNQYKIGKDHEFKNELIQYNDDDHSVYINIPQFPTKHPLTLCLIDITGKMIEMGNTKNDSEYFFESTGFSTGIYILRISNSEFVKSQKIYISK